jgi:hypothetical protein
MNTETGRIYHGERESKKDVALSAELANALKKVNESDRPEFFTNSKFEEWYKTIENDSETARRDRMKLAFKAGWEAREREI